MAKKAELRAVLTLNNTQFGRTIRRSIQMGRDLARQFARTPIQATFVAGALAARKAVQTTARTIERVGSVARTSFKIGAVAALGIATALAFVSKSAVNAAADLEDFQTSFTVLLGNAQRAQQRMRELVNFANATPFSLREVAQASVVMETLTRGALSTGKGLRMVGDVASGTNKEFGDMAVTIGRLYDALRSGRSAGDSLATLQQIGAISGNARRQIEGLGAANMGAEAWKIAQSELARFDGMMEKKSKTWNGAMATFRDAIVEALRQFGMPLLTSLKPTVFLMKKMVLDFAPKMSEVGEKFGRALRNGIDFIRESFKDPSVLVGPLESGLKVAFMSAGNVFIASIKAAVSVIGQPGFFSSIAKAFMGLSKIIGGSLMQAFQKPIAYLIAGVTRGIEIASDPKKFVEREKILMDIDTAKNNIKKFNPDGSGLPSLFGKKLINMGPSELQEQQNVARQELASARERLKAWNDRNGYQSIDRMANDMIKNGSVAGSAKDSIAEGERDVKTATSKILSGFADGLKTFKVDDVLGAGKEAAKAKEAVNSAASSARARDARDELKARQQGPSPYFRSRFSNLQGAFGSGALSAAAQRTTPLLKVRERRQFENETVAGQMAAGLRNARRGSTASAFGAVRKGDRERMREVQREKLREKAGLDKTNNILESIQRSFDALTR